MTALTDSPDLLLGLAALLALALSYALAMRWRHRHLQPDTANLKAWIVIPIALAALIGAALFCGYQVQQRRATSRQEMRARMEQVQHEWQRHAMSVANLLQLQTEHLTQNPELRNAWLAQDLSALTAVAQPLFGAMKRDWNVTHFYLIAPDRTCFLRVHQPDRRNDLIARHTLLTAERTGLATWGLELGPLGTFTLRYVLPWIHDGRRIGYLELGMETENLARELAEDTGFEVATVLWKAHTTQAAFEAGRRAFGFAGQWDAYPEVVVAGQTASALPAEVQAWLQTARRPTAASRTPIFRAHQDDRELFCGVTPLADAAGRDVAALVIMRDITAESAAANRALLLNAALALLLLTAVLVLLTAVTGAAQRQLIGAYAALRDREERLQYALDATTEGLWDWNIKTGAVFYSPRWITLLGYTPQKVPANVEFRNGIIHPEDRPRVTAALNAHFAGHTPVYECENRLRLKSGEYRHNLSRGRVVAWDAAGAPLRMLGTDSDISARQRTEEALRQSEEKYRSVVENAGEAVFVVQRGRIRFANLACTRLVGLSEAELLTKTIADFLTEADRDRMMTRQQQRQRGETTEDQEEYRMVLPSGAEHWLAVSAVPITWQGAPATLNFAMDMTARKQAEERLRRANRTLRVLGACNHARLQNTAEKELAQRVCQAAVDIGGYRMAWVGLMPETGGPLPQIVASAGDDEGFLRTFSDTVPASEFERTPSLTAIHTGSIVINRDFATNPRVAAWRDLALARGYASSISLPLQANGTPLGVLTLYAAQTQAFDADEVGLLQELAGDLTAAILALRTQRQHQQATTALRESLQEKDGLLREVHHRVKNNLQVISSVLRLQAGQLGDANARAALRGTQDRVRSMALLHETLYRSENLARVNMAAYLETVCAQLTRFIAARPGDIQLRVDVALVFFEVSQAVSCGLLVNELVSNAFKHGFPDGRTGEVRLELQPVDGGPALRLRVADNGAGLPAAFDLQKLHSLGLQLVSDLAGQLQGQLVIGKEPGGATIEVCFTPTPLTANPPRPSWVRD